MDQSKDTLEPPLVSIWVMSFNQEAYLEQALESVFAQDYAAVEVILVDDGSSDASRGILKKYLERPEVKVALLQEKNRGYCAMLNQALAWSKGKYVIDFSPDDLLKPDRLSSQVAFFEQCPPSAGFIYSDAQYIDVAGKKMGGNHFSLPRMKGMEESGFLFSKLLASYFIPTPTVMYRRQALMDVGGFDESLSYEDFDILLRLSYHYPAYYFPVSTTFIRKRPDSLSTQYYKQGGKHLVSTLRVCEKIIPLLRDSKEQRAMQKRLSYECRQAFLHGYAEIGNRFLQLWSIIPNKIPSYYLLQVWRRFPFNKG